MSPLATTDMFEGNRTDAHIGNRHRRGKLARTWDHSR